MRICPSCGHENAEDARFCSQCATPLDAEAPAREERKVVTCLFCDLVGFTARTERMDPEDVRRLLQPYHAQVRAELERLGGTVEKFIGDAVMAVFGAPIAHEDDPERAVRAALSIRDRLVEDGELEVRIGVTTGEALVLLGARPAAGEGMASGDVVNTAARLQSAAPVNGILVDETTYRATGRAIEYEARSHVDAKGKSEPVPVWAALRVTARVAVERVGGATLVGREQEVALLRETLARVVRERQPQLVTLVGVPGIGKSRLVFELFEAIERGDYGLVFWRHGRSLPYGDGVTFWALGEMVKAQAGILESDGHDEAGDKLRAAVARFVDDASDAAWIERRLRPLAGLEETDESSADRRGETFAAWRRFFEAIADERPLVLVFEDLHWADDILLDFVDYLLDWATGVPLLVLGTARPELLTRSPGWGGGKVNSSTIQLSPLTDEETAALVHELLGRAVIDADLQSRLLEHAGGNPLYAEEFTRMQLERPADVVLPESVQGMIAARLDTLPGDEKALLQDAAVIGRVFWLGALGRERWNLEERLHSLTRKEFITRNRRSSVAGEDEYVFRHALVRDVAYEQIPRAERVDKHRSTAEWIESLARIEDHAEMLAHHYGAALEYARATRNETDSLRGRARTSFREAGDRALALNAFHVAARHYVLALELWPEDDPERAELLFGLARARHVGGDESRVQSLEDAREALLAVGRVEQAAHADALLAEAVWYLGDRARCDFHLDRAAASVHELPPSPAKTYVLCQISRYRSLAGKPDDAIRVGEEALAMAEELGLDELRTLALINIGGARGLKGEDEGIAMLERAAELALAAHSPEAARAYNNLGAAQTVLGDFTRARPYFFEAARIGDELGALPIARFARAQVAGNLLWSGYWEEGFQLAEKVLAESAGYEMVTINLRRQLVRTRFLRDDVDGALTEMAEVLDGVRQTKDPQFAVPALGAAARLYAEVGRAEEARELAVEALEHVQRTDDWRALELAFVAERLGIADELREVIEHFPPRWKALNLAVVSGEDDKAAELFLEMGVPLAAADARRRAGERLLSEGRRAEAEAQLEQALACYRSIGATRSIRECDALLREASEVSA